MVLDFVPKFIGFLYALLMTGILAYLWYTGRWRHGMGWVLLLVSSGLGFLIFSPIAPYQFQQLVLRDVQGLGAPLLAGALGLLVMVFLVFVFGRFFCGYLCPAGTVQEIAYRLPVPKWEMRQKSAFMVIRAGFFIVFLVMALILSLPLLAWFGIRDFFYLVLSTGSVVFALLLLFSVVLYRPFCRLVCPYGLLLSAAAAAGLFRLERTESCIGCGKCEKACPADEAKRGDKKAECYLCGRCTDVCPAEGALRYMRHQ